MQASPMATCEYCGEPGASVRDAGVDRSVRAHPCCRRVADYCHGGDATREQAARCPHEIQDLDPLGIRSGATPVREPPPGGAHEDIDGKSCDGTLEVESPETLYCTDCGAIVSRATGELLGHGTPMSG